MRLQAKEDLTKAIYNREAPTFKGGCVSYDAFTVELYPGCIPNLYLNWLDAVKFYNAVIDICIESNTNANPQIYGIMWH